MRRRRLWQGLTATAAMVAVAALIYPDRCPSREPTRFAFVITLPIPKLSSTVIYTK